MPSTQNAPTQESIANDLAEYLRDHARVCAAGNATGWTWLRHYNDEWQAVRYSRSDDRSREFVEGKLLSQQEAISWLTSKPARLIPQSNAGDRVATADNVWEDVDRQAVFSDIDERCFYCGDGEESTTLTSYETIEDGTCSLCDECAELWMDAGEIVEKLTP